MIQKHFTATGVVLDETGRALLILHKKLGVWLPPGGHVEPNETPDAAVLREIFEETGVRANLPATNEPRSCADEWAFVLPSPIAVFLEDIGCNGDHFHIDLIYRCRADGQTGQRNPAETDALGWFAKEEIETLNMYHNARSIVLHEIEQFECEKGTRP